MVDRNRVYITASRALAIRPAKAGAQGWPNGQSRTIWRTGGSMQRKALKCTMGNAMQSHEPETLF